MAEGPDDLNAVPSCCLQRGEHSGEVEFAPLLHQVPANTLSNRPNSEFSQSAVVLIYQQVMLGSRDHVDPGPGAVDV